MFEAATGGNSVAALLSALEAGTPDLMKRVLSEDRFVFSKELNAKGLHLLR